jgi:hypothetical protein
MICRQITGLNLPSVVRLHAIGAACMVSAPRVISFNQERFNLIVSRNEIFEGD